MGNPKTEFATCRICGKRIQWKQATLTDQQLAENAEADAYNKEHGLTSSWKDEDYVERPHRPPSFRPRWTHAGEKAGENNIACDTEENKAVLQNNLDQGYRNPLAYVSVAEPLEFCCARTYDREFCNLSSRPQEEWSIYSYTPKCGRHLKPDIEEYTRRKESEERRAIENWARQSIEEVANQLKDKYGLDWRHERAYGTPSGNVVVNAQELLDLLEGKRKDNS